MSGLLDQRCFNHAVREAAVQCPSCKRFFCRECVTEHSGRMICVNCVATLARDEQKSARTARAQWTVLALAGIVVAWVVFYYLGLTLARIPSEFHSTTSIRAPYGTSIRPGGASFSLQRRPQPTSVAFIEPFFTGAVNL